MNPPSVEEADTRTMLENPQMDYTKSLWAVRSFRKTEKSPDRNQKALLHVNDVTASYSKSIEMPPVLSEVNFEIYRGETVAVVGESGSGKSTTARVITGLLSPTEGKIIFDDEILPADYRNRSLHQLQQIQMIYQMPDTAINPHHRIRDIIGRPLSFYLNLEGSEKKQRLHELMEMIELDPKQFLGRFPSELSGGQKQRICIARALAANPSFIICDEVTSALDQLVAEEILRLLDRLQQELNLAYMFITHDLATVKAIADRVVVMLQGSIVDQGPKDEVFAPPYHEYTQLLLSSVPEMDPDWMDRVMAERTSTGSIESAGN